MTARDLCWTEEQTKALMNEMMEKKKYVEVLEVFATKFGDLFTLYRDEEDYEVALEEYEDGSSDEDEETDDEDEDDGVIARLGAVIARINERKENGVKLSQYAIETDTDKLFGFRDEYGSLWLEDGVITFDEEEVMERKEVNGKMFVLLNDASQWNQLEE
jgi:hypothetical protein